MTYGNLAQFRFLLLPFKQEVIHAGNKIIVVRPFNNQFEVKRSIFQMVLIFSFWISGGSSSLLFLFLLTDNADLDDLDCREMSFQYIQIPLQVKYNLP